MSESPIPSHSSSEKVELSIHIDSELLDQIKHLTNDPSKVIETAIKQWLRGERREDELALGLRRNPPVPPRGEWNDWGSRVGDGARKSAGCKVTGCEISIARALGQISRRKLQVVGEMARARLTTSELFKVREKMRSPVPDLSCWQPQILA
jgi:hypothetical protein